MQPARVDEVTEVELVFERPSYVRRVVLGVKNSCRSAERIVAHVILGMGAGLALAMARSDDATPSMSFLFFALIVGVLSAPVTIVVAAAARASSPPVTLRSVTFRQGDLYMQPEGRAGYVAPWDWVLGAAETGDGLWLDVMSFEGYLPGLRQNAKPTVLVARARFTPEQLAWLRSRLEERGCPCRTGPRRHAPHRA